MGEPIADLLAAIKNAPAVAHHANSVNPDLPESGPRPFRYGSGPLNHKGRMPRALIAARFLKIHFHIPKMFEDGCDGFV
ncbi:MAG TPA: hypothetical protein DDW72_05330 [Afipia sp.]|nr:hypothetical protein [Afipia sp.]